MWKANELFIVDDIKHIIYIDSPCGEFFRWENVKEEDLVMEKRIGVVAIVVESKENIEVANRILSEFANIIVGRMGIPYREKNISIISLIVDGSNDDIGALTGKLGKLNGVNVKSALTKK